MLPTTARRKLLTNEKGNEIIDAESGFHSQVDFSSANSSEITNPRRKSYCLASHRGSYKQESFSSSSGYGSSFSLTGSSSGASASALISPAKNRKRKSEVTATDENFYNSYQFVSPLKIRKRDVNDKNCAKLILKEKCSSENVILTSTPTLTEQRASKWGKFRSFHPEKLQFGKSIEELEPVAVKDSSAELLNFSASFNLSSANVTQDIPEAVQHLWTGDIKIETVTSSKAVDAVVKQQVEVRKAPERQFFNGRERFDILGMLNARQDIALNEILKRMDDKSLLNISHVSKHYRDMITSNKVYETKRTSYLKHHRSNLENKYPNNNFGKQRASQGEKKAFGTSNLNHMSLRQRPTTPPQSPQRRNLSLQQKSFASKKCPRCSKPAVVRQITIRSSPRKNRKKKLGTSLNILQLSPHGRISKRSRTLLSKTSIDGFNEAHKISHTFPLSFDEEKSSTSSSGCESPCGNCSSSGSEDSNDEIYEFAECTAVGCCFKFCVKCNCRYHPKFKCADLSPPSPSRLTKNPVACSKTSRKNLKRLFDK